MHHLKIDPRIRKVIQLIHQDVSRDFSIEELASTACLSHSQFKLLFNKSINMTPIQHTLPRLKMEKARSLLSNTDTPINLIAEQVGLAIYPRLHAVLTLILASLQRLFAQGLRARAFSIIDDAYRD